MDDGKKTFLIFSPLKNDAWSNFVANLGFKSSPYDPRYSTTILKFEPRKSDKISGVFERWMVVNEDTRSEKIELDDYCRTLKVEKADSIDITLDVLTFLQNDDLAKHLHIMTQVCINTILEQCGQAHNMLPDEHYPTEEECQRELLQNCVVKSARPLQLPETPSISFETDSISKDLKRLCFCHVLPSIELLSKQVNTKEMTAMQRVDGLTKDNTNLKLQYKIIQDQCKEIQKELNHMTQDNYKTELEKEKVSNLYEEMQLEAANMADLVSNLQSNAPTSEDELKKQQEEIEKLKGEVEQKTKNYQETANLLALRVNEATENKLKIQKLETEKEKIAKELKELQEQSEQPANAALLQEEKKQKEALQQELEKIQIEKEKVEQERKTIEDAFDLQLQKSTDNDNFMEGVSNAAIQQVEHLETFLQDLLAKSNQDQNQLSSTHQALDALASNMQREMEKAMNTLNTKLSEASQRMNLPEQTSFMSTLESMIAKVESATTMKQAVEEELKQKITEHESKIKEMESKLEKAESETSEVIKDKDNVLEELRNAQEELGLLKRQVESGQSTSELQKQIEIWKEKLEDTRKKLTASYEEKAELEQEKEDILKDKSEFMERNFTLRGENDSLQKRIAELTESNNTAIALHAEYENEKIEMTDKLENEKKTVDDLKQRMQKNIDIIERFKSQVPQLQQIQELCHEIHTQIGQMNDTPDSRRRRRTTIVSVDAAKLEMERNQGIIVTHHNEVLKAQEELKQLKQEFATLIQDLQQKDRQNESMKKELEEKTTAYDTIQKQLEDSQNMLIKYKTESEAQTTRVEELEALVAKLKEDEDKSHDLVTEITEQISVLSNLVKNYEPTKDTVQLLTTQLSNACEEISELAVILAENEEKLRSDIKKLQGDIATLQSNLTDANQAAESAKNELESKTSEMQANITKLESELAGEQKLHRERLSKASEDHDKTQQELQRFKTEFDTTDAKIYFENVCNRIDVAVLDVSTRQEIVKMVGEKLNLQSKHGPSPVKKEDIGEDADSDIDMDGINPLNNLFEKEKNKERRAELNSILAQIQEVEEENESTFFTNIMNPLKEKYAKDLKSVKETLEGIQEYIYAWDGTDDDLKRILHAYIFGIILCEIYLLQEAGLDNQSIPFLITSLGTPQQNSELLGIDKIAIIDSVYYFLRVAVGIADQKDKNKWNERQKKLQPDLVEVTRFMFLFLDGVSKATGVIQDVLNAVDKNGAAPSWETLKKLVTDPALRARTLADVDFPLVSQSAYHVAPSHSWFQPAPAYETAQQASCSGLSGFTQQLPPATYHYAYGQMY